ncbi:MAG: hypothetical protein KDK99_17740 [Verrucomicrobiales bacterium]|nr:hypothetical protein [Verrucomicrobiales bacterium]
MSTSGLLIMIVSVSVVTLLFVGCVWKVLTSPSGESEKLHAADLHTPDMDRK